MEEKPQPSENHPSYSPPVLPPATGAPARAKSPVLWIVAGVVGMLAVGGLLFGCLLCAGVAVFLSPTSSSSEFEYVDSKSGPATYDPYVTPVETMPMDAWSEPAYSGDYSTEAAIAPDATAPADAAYGSTYDEPLFPEPEEAYDPDWQLELPQYQQDAIRDLNAQKEMFGSP